MEKIFNWIKNFKYKTVSVITILIITQIIFRLTDAIWVSYISLAAFLYLLYSLVRATYFGIKNTYKDGDKGFAIAVSIIMVIILGFAAFLAITS